MFTKSYFNLTPFLFGVLRNYYSFLDFFNNLPNQKWIKYSKVIIKGLLIAIKASCFMFK
jgi:hypothetical protein